MREVLSALEERLDEPTAKALASAVSRAIRDGVLEPGDQLPPIRRVAEQLMISPTTVSAAWQLLTRSGAIRPDGRRGTTVIGPRGGGERYSTAVRRQPGSRLDLSTGIPDPHLLPDLSHVLGGFTAMAPTSYLDDPVVPELRELLLATWPYPTEELLVVDGAMDAIDLVTRTLFRPGDRVVVENPAFPPVLDLLEDRGIIVEGVGLDENGPRADDLERLLARRPAGLLIQPRSQNPTGVSMSQDRAQELARLLAPTDCCVIEDDSACEVSSSELVSLGAFLPDRVIHIRSFSKSHGPDLRLAAMSGPEALLAPVRRARALGQGWTSRLLQRTLAALLVDDGARAAVAHARREYVRRRQLVVDRLEARGISVPGTDGLNIWVPVRDEAAAVLRLASHGIAVTPGAPFAVDRAERDGHIRVTTALVDHDHEAIADLVADAAMASSWSARHR